MKILDDDLKNKKKELYGKIRDRKEGESIEDYHAYLQAWKKKYKKEEDSVDERDAELARRKALMKLKK